MNAGKNYAKAKAQAQANADHARSPRWLHQYGGVWWISGTPTTNSEQIDPRKKSSAQIKREIDEVLTKKPSSAVQEPITEVMFRVFPEGDVIALFPQDQQGAGMINSYQHLGQHGEASRKLIKELRRASPTEYAPLLTELESIGYRLRIK